MATCLWLVEANTILILVLSDHLWYSGFMSAPRASEDQIRWFRLRRSGLVTPFKTPELAAHALVGVQAQILPAAAIALFNRSARSSFRSVLDRLWKRRSLIKIWGQRSTLHLYKSDDWPLLMGALAGRTWQERQLERHGGDVEAWKTTVAAVANMLEERGTIGRSDLRASELDLDDDALSSWGGVFADLVRTGRACHAPPKGNEGRFAWRESWLPDLEWRLPERGPANAELLRRYLRSFGPAPLSDFSYWRGVSGAVARDARERLAEELIDIASNDEASPMLLHRDDLPDLLSDPPQARDWPVHMLGRFDPFLLGHRDKSWLVSDDDYERVWKKAGHIEGVILHAGRIAGTWRYQRESSGFAVEVFPLRKLPARVCAAISARAAALARFFGLPVGPIVFSALN